MQEDRNNFLISNRTKRSKEILEFLAGTKINAVNGAQW